MLANISILNWPKVSIDLILMELLTTMLTRFVPRLWVIFYIHMEYMVLKIKSFKTKKYE